MRVEVKGFAPTADKDIDQSRPPPGALNNWNFAVVCRLEFDKEGVLTAINFERFHYHMDRRGGLISTAAEDVTA